MNTLEKRDKFVVISLHEGIGHCVSLLGNQSIQTKLSCGCKMIHHPLVKPKENAVVDAGRRFFIEFCNKHKEKR